MGTGQIELIDLVVNPLTEHGVMDPSLLYESPFTDIAPQGSYDRRPLARVDELVSLLATIRSPACT